MVFRNAGRGEGTYERNNRIYLNMCYSERETKSNQKQIHVLEL